MENQKIMGIVLFILGILLVIGYIYFASVGSPPTLSLKGMVLNFLYLAWMSSVLVVSICMLTDKKLRFFEKLSLSSFILMFMGVIVFSIWQNDLKIRSTTDLGLEILCLIYLAIIIAAVCLVFVDFYSEQEKKESLCPKAS